MGIFPKGFGSGELENTLKSVEGCTVAKCPMCNQKFYRDKAHQMCNMCSMGMVWNGHGYTYYPGLDKSKQNKDDV